MQQTINIQELENALNKYGDIVLTKNSKNDVIIMSISEYKRKLKDNELSKKLEKAEQQIKDGKTVNSVKQLENGIDVDIRLIDGKTKAKIIS